MASSVVTRIHLTTCCSLNVASSISCTNVLAASKLLIAIIKQKREQGGVDKKACVQQVVYLSFAEDLICVIMWLGASPPIEMGHVCNMCANASADNTNLADEP